MFNNETIGNFYRVYPKEPTQKDFKILENSIEYALLQAEMVKSAINDFNGFNPLVIFMLQCQECLYSLPLFLQFPYKDLKMILEKKTLKDSFKGIDNFCENCRKEMDLSSLFIFGLADLKIENIKKVLKDILFIKIESVLGDQETLIYKMIKINKEFQFKELENKQKFKIFHGDFNIYP